MFTYLNQTIWLSHWAFKSVARILSRDETPRMRLMRVHEGWQSHAGAHIRGGCNPPAQHSNIRTKSQSQACLTDCIKSRSKISAMHENCLIHKPQMSSVHRSIFSSKYFKSVSENREWHFQTSILHNFPGGECPCPP